MSEDLRYPIGKFSFDAEGAKENRNASIQTIEELPVRLRQAIGGLNEEHLQTPYREGGWTVHQLIHHVADSHMNAYCRFKLGFTENNPTIRTYEEKLWAETADVRELPVNISITLLFALHQR